MKYFETFRFSLEPLETSLCEPNLGLEITDLDPAFKPRVWKGPVHEKKNWEDSLLFCAPAAHGTSSALQSATQYHL